MCDLKAEVDAGRKAVDRVNVEGTRHFESERKMCAMEKEERRRGEKTMMVLQ